MRDSNFAKYYSRRIKSIISFQRIELGKVDEKPVRQWVQYASSPCSLSSALYTFNPPQSHQRAGLYIFIPYH